MLGTHVLIPDNVPSFPVLLECCCPCSDIWGDVGGVEGDELQHVEVESQGRAFRRRREIAPREQLLRGRSARTNVQARWCDVYLLS